MPKEPHAPRRPHGPGDGRPGLRLRLCAVTDRGARAAEVRAEEQRAKCGSRGGRRGAGPAAHVAGRALRLPGPEGGGVAWGRHWPSVSVGDSRMCPAVAQACRPSSVQHALIKHLLHAGSGPRGVGAGPTLVEPRREGMRTRLLRD